MCSGKYGSCLDPTTDANGSMDIYSAGPNSASDNSSQDGSGSGSASDPSWTAPGAQRYIGIIIVVVLAFIALLCWMFFARWPRQQIRRVFSNRNRRSLPESSLHHNHSSSSSSTTAAAATETGRGRSEFEAGGELEKGRGAGWTKGTTTRDREMGQSKTEIRILEVKEEESSQWRSSEKMTVQLPQKPTPCAPHKKSRSYGLDWIKGQTSSSPRYVRCALCPACASFVCRTSLRRLSCLNSNIAAAHFS